MGSTSLSLEQWALLYERPLFAFLNLAGEVTGRSRSEQRELQQHFRDAPPSADLQVSLTDLGLAGAWHLARQRVTDSPEFATAAAQADLAALTHATALAIVAELTRNALSTGRAVPDDETRDLWVNLTAHLLWPPFESRPDSRAGTRGFTEAKQAVTGLLGFAGQWMAAGFAERKRLTEAESIAPVVGDIILYQSPRGEAIRRRFRERVFAADKPRYVLAHSLGSVAAVDAAILHPELEIDHLFTIGSPAPVFFELNALVALERSAQLPAHFPKWTNIFDPKDLISYIAHRTFHYDPRVNDRCHLSGQPLIAAHSAYWASNRAWAHIWKSLP